MDTSSKNRLQEYCNKHKFLLPNYRVIKRSGPMHALRFQTEVEINGQWYLGDDLCQTKKQAEQSAARRALEAIANNEEKLISTDDFDSPPPPYSEIVKSNAVEHLPSEYAQIERYMIMMVESFNGRVRKIWAPDTNGLYKFEIAGKYRYCDNIQEHHKHNQIYFMVDPVNRTYYQMCYNSQCSGFRSVTRNITIKSPVSINEKEHHPTDSCIKLTDNVNLDDIN